MRVINENIKTIFDSHVLMTECEIIKKNTSQVIESGMFEQLSIETKLDRNKTFKGEIAHHFIEITLKPRILAQNHITLNENDVIIVKFYVVTNAHAFKMGSPKERQEINTFEFTLNKIAIDNDRNKINVHGVDKTYIFNQKYISPNYPLNAYQLLQYIVNQCGLTLANGYIETVKQKLMQFVIQNDPYINDKEITYAQVLKEIFTIFNLIAFIRYENNTNYLVIQSLNNPQISTVSLNKNYLNFEKHKTSHLNHVNTLTFQQKDIQGENISLKQNNAQTQDNEYIIEDVILFPTETQQRIDLLNNVKSLVYGMQIPNFQLEYLTRPYLEIGDGLLIDDVVYKILHYRYTFDGGFKCDYGAILNDDKIVTPFKNEPIRKLINDTKILVDKQKQEITMLVQQVDDTNDRIQSVEQKVTTSAIETKIISVVEERKQEIATVIVSETPPQNTSKIWVNNVNGKMHIYKNNEWVEIFDLSTVYQTIDNEITNINNTTVTKDELSQFQNNFDEEKQKLEEYSAYNRTKLNALEIFKESVLQFQNNTEQVTKMFKMDNNGFRISQEGNPIELGLDNGEIAFFDSGIKVATFSNRQLIITSVKVLHELYIGKYKLKQIENSPLLEIIYVGG